MASQSTSTAQGFNQCHILQLALRYSRNPQALSATMHANLMHLMQPVSMDTSFSMEISDVQDTSQPHLQQDALRHAIVLCWENVLVPAKWMNQHLGVKPTPKALQEAHDRVRQNPYLQETMRVLDHHIVRLLSTLAQYGPVFIVTEETTAFVHAMCRMFFPQLAACLTHPSRVQVLGTDRRLTSSNEKALWRMQLVPTLCYHQLYSGAAHLLFDEIWGRFGLVMVTPHALDAVACCKLNEIAPLAIPKTILMQRTKRMPLNQFLMHLQTLEYTIRQAVCTPSAFNVEV